MATVSTIATVSGTFSVTDDLTGTITVSGPASATFGYPTGPEYSVAGFPPTAAVPGHPGTPATFDSNGHMLTSEIASVASQPGVPGISGFGNQQHAATIQAAFNFCYSWSADTIQIVYLNSLVSHVANIRSDIDVLSSRGSNVHQGIVTSGVCWNDNDGCPSNAKLIQDALNKTITTF